MPDWSKMSMLGRRTPDEESAAPVSEQGRQVISMSLTTVGLSRNQLFRSDMPDPYAASSSSMSPASFMNDRRHDLASSSTASLPQLEASEDTLPSASELLFEAPEEDGTSDIGALCALFALSRIPPSSTEGSVPTINPSTLASHAAHSTDKKGKGRATMAEPEADSTRGQNDPDMNPAVRRGWLAHQSIFPSSARAQSPLEASRLTPSPISTDRKLQDTNSPEAIQRQLREGIKPDGRRPKSGRRSSMDSSSTGSFTDGSYDDDDMGSSGDEDDMSDAGFDDPRRLQDPIALGVEGVELPPRLEVLHDKMGYWANGRETISRYNGQHRYRTAPSGSTSDTDYRMVCRSTGTDPIWLASWLFSIVGVLIALCFVWGGTDVSAAHSSGLACRLMKRCTVTVRSDSDTQSPGTQCQISDSFLDSFAHDPSTLGPGPGGSRCALSLPAAAPEDRSACPCGKWSLE